MRATCSLALWPQAGNRYCSPRPVASVLWVGLWEEQWVCKGPMTSLSLGGLGLCATWRTWIPLLGTSVTGQLAHQSGVDCIHALEDTAGCRTGALAGFARGWTSEWPWRSKKLSLPARAERLRGGSCSKQCHVVKTVVQESAPRQEHVCVSATGCLSPWAPAQWGAAWAAAHAGAAGGGGRVQAAVVTRVVLGPEHGGNACGQSARACGSCIHMNWQWGWSVVGTPSCCSGILKSRAAEEWEVSPWSGQRGDLRL